MKKLFLLVIILTTMCLLIARYSDQYPLGTYSFISEEDWFMYHLHTLSGAMNSLGYNSTIMETKLNNPTNLTSIFSVLYSDSIDVVIRDRVWSSNGGNEKYATTGLTTSSYYKFEAEYEDGRSVTGTDLTDSQYWYGSRDEDIADDDNDIDRIGFPYRPTNVIPPASNNYVWRCEPDSVGYAYTDLRWRWPKSDSLNIRIGQEFYLNKYSSTAAQDTLYLKYRFRYYIPSSDELPGDTILLSFAPVGFQYTYDVYGNVNGHMQTPEAIVHTNGLQTSEELSLH